MRVKIHNFWFIMLRKNHLVLFDVKEIVVRQFKSLKRIRYEKKKLEEKGFFVLERNFDDGE